MFIPGNSGSGGGGGNEDAALETFIDGLKLEVRLDPVRYMTGNFELDLHRKESVALFIWRELEHVVRFYVSRVLPHGAQMDPEHLEEGLKETFDEYTMRVHRLLLRRMLEGKTVALNEIVREVFNPKTDEYSDFRKRLRNNVLFLMRDLGLWNVEEEMLISKRTGNRFHAGFRISAGPALMAFNRLVYVPWTIRHTLFFAAYLSKFHKDGVA